MDYCRSIWHLFLFDVYAALAHYYDHLKRLGNKSEEDEAYARELQAQTPSLVQQKLKQQKCRERSLHLDENSVATV